jgi:receptor protein-tyrosine kinase
MSKNYVEIDFVKLEEKGFVTTQQKRSKVNEEYSSIKRKLLNNAFGSLSETIKNSNLIMVTSAKPNEGKTFTAINLALSIALEQDKTVLLVDADVLRPSVSKVLDVNTHVGLTEYLLGTQRDVADIIYKTNLDNLRVIPAGHPHHLSSELLASERMFKLAKEFTSRYPDRVVIFDAPPLLGVNETTVLASLTGQGVVVVEANNSKVAEVRQAVEMLPDEMAVGFVLNKVLAHKEHYYYGY